MIVIYNNIIPFPGYKAINLFGIVFVRKNAKHRFTDVDYNHEHIHLKQLQETLWIGFYLWYMIEYILVRIVGLFKKKSQGESYHDISFEEEAHNNDTNLNYIKTRKHYAWFRYVKIGSYKKN